MLNFKEYMIPQPDFERVLAAVQAAMDQEQYDQAWDLLKKARPRNEDEASEKAMYISEFENNREKFLIAMKKKGQV